MIAFMGHYWYLFLLVFLVGVFATITLTKQVKSLYQNFTSKVPIIRKYWSFVTSFSLILAVVYFLTFKYAAQSNLANYLSLLGQVAALIFAIFVGYFAFLGVVENRITPLREAGFQHFKNKRYVRAEKAYKQVIAIDTEDFHNFAELLEIYLATKDFLKFDENIVILEKNILDKNDNLILFYLKISMELLREHLDDARLHIIQLIDFKTTNPNTNFSWDVRDLQGSPAFTGLRDGEAKTILNNLILYLQSSMPPENRERFVRGDYVLTPPETSVAP